MSHILRGILEQIRKPKTLPSTENGGIYYVQVRLLNRLPKTRTDSVTADANRTDEVDYDRWRSGLAFPPHKTWGSLVAARRISLWKKYSPVSTNIFFCVSPQQEELEGWKFWSSASTMGVMRGRWKYRIIFNNAWLTWRMRLLEWRMRPPILQ